MKICSKSQTLLIYIERTNYCNLIITLCNLCAVSFGLKLLARQSYAYYNKDSRQNKWCYGYIVPSLLADCIWVFQKLYSLTNRYFCDKKVIGMLISSCRKNLEVLKRINFVWCHSYNTSVYSLWPTCVIIW